MSAILHAADTAIARGDPPNLASYLLPAIVRRILRPIVDKVGIVGLDPDQLAEFTAADGIHPMDATEERLRPLEDRLFAVEHELAHVTVRHQRSILERRRREVKARIEREETQLITSEIAARFRLETAEDMLRAAPVTGPPARRVPLVEAEATTRAAIERFFTGQGPRHLLVTAEPGLGKTYHMVNTVSDLAQEKRHARNLAITEWRRANPTASTTEAASAVANAGHRLLRVLYLADTHQLLSQTVEDALEHGLTVVHMGSILRPIDPGDPNSPPACTQHARVTQTRAAGDSVPDKGCGRGTDGPHCPDLGGCRFWQRWADMAHAEFVAMTVDTATQPHLARELRGFDFIIVDESPARAIYGENIVPLDHLSDRHFVAHPVRDAKGEPDVALTNKARAGYALVRAAFDSAPDGYAPQVQPDLLGELLDLTEARDAPSGITAGTPDTERAELSRASFRRPVRGICGLFRQMLAAPGFVRLETEDIDRRVAVVRGVRQFHPSMLESPILALDGSGDLNEWRRGVPDMVEVTVPKVEAPYETAVQIVLPMGKRAMGRQPQPAHIKGNLNRRHLAPGSLEIAQGIAALYAHGETVVQTHKGFGADFEHVGPVLTYGAAAGLRVFERARTSITFGLPSLSPKGAAYEGAGKTGEIVPVEMPRRVLLPVWMKDGTVRLVPSMENEHPAAREAQAAWRDRQAIQGPGGRARGIRRTKENPLTAIYVGTSPIPGKLYDSVIRGPADLAAPRTLIMASRGFVYQTAHMRHRMLPDLYPEEWTADYDIARERDGNPDPQAAFVTMMRRVVSPSWHPGPIEPWTIVRFWRARSRGNRKGGELAACRMCDLPELTSRLMTSGATKIEVVEDIQPKNPNSSIHELERIPEGTDDSWVLPTSWRKALIQGDGLARTGIETGRLAETPFGPNNDLDCAASRLTAPPDG